MASEVKYGERSIVSGCLFSGSSCCISEVLENVNPDLSDSEFIEQEVPLDAPTPAVSDLGDAQTPGDLGDGDEYEGEENDDEVEGDIDEELAAELDLALENEDEDEDGDDEDDDDDSDEDDSEDEDDEEVQARKLLSEEVRDLEAAVAKKRNEIANSGNPLIRVCPSVLLCLSLLTAVFQF